MKCKICEEELKHEGYEIEFTIWNHEDGSDVVHKECHERMVEKHT